MPRKKPLSTPRTAGALKPASYNPRRISPEAEKALRRAMTEFGDISGLVFNMRTGRLIAGHQRRKQIPRGAKLTKADDVTDDVGTVGYGYSEAHGTRWPVRFVDWPEAREKAANVAANSPLLAGEFTSDLDEILGDLKVEMPGLMQHLRLDCLKLDLSASDLKEGLTDPDAVPAPNDELRSERGDIWVLGEHRLLCGDATDKDDVAAVMDGRQADMVFTDPPYNMNYKSKPLGGIANDCMADAAFVQFILASAHSMLSALRSGGSYYICMSSREFATVCHQLRKIGLNGRVIIWAKPSPGLGAQEYRPAHEVLLYGFVGGKSERLWLGGRTEGDVWEFDAGRAVVAREDEHGMVLEFGSGVETTIVRLSKKSKGTVISFDGEVSDLWRIGRDSGYVHPTQKPIPLICRALRNSSQKGDTVLDVFCGSGSTIIAAEQLDRRCCAIELDPAYVDVAVTRWEQFTGRKAEKAKRA